MQNPEEEFYSVNYSPDSQWITYTKSGKNNMSVVYVYHLTSGKEYPVTEKWYDSSSPCFSTDGKYLILLPSAISTLSIARQNGIMLTTVWGVYIALLAKDTPSPFLPSDEKISIEDNAPGNKAATKENKADNKAGQATGVTIDTEGLPGRLLKLPLAAGYYYQLYSDGKSMVFQLRQHQSIRLG